MVALILFSLLILPLLYLYGRAVNHLIGTWFQTDPDTSPGIVLTALVGLASLTMLAMLFSLFIPLSVLAVGIVLAGGVVILAWLLFSGQFKNTWIQLKPDLPALAWLLLILILFSIFEQATHRPVNPDSGIYHAQTIRWAETFPAIPGLGNLHGRLAFNSSWLVIQALVSFAFLGERSFHLLPAILSMLVLFDSFRGLLGWLHGQATIANILKTLIIPVFFYVLPSEISSPGTDLPVVLLIWFLAIAWIERPPRFNQPPGVHDLAVFILALLAVTIKLSAAPLLILTAIVFISVLRKPVLIAKLAVITLAFMAPWFARSVIQSGYLVYPVMAVDIFDVDWKVPAGGVRAERNAIVAYARLPRMERSEVLAMETADWLRQWFANLTTNRKLVLALAGLSPILFIGGISIESLWRERLRIEGMRLITVYVVAGLGSVYWLFTAPDFRFGYGYLMLLILIPLLLPMTWVSQALKGRMRLLPQVILVGLILFQALFFVRSFESKTFTQRILLPIDYPALPTEPCALKNRRVMCAAPISYNECWYDPFPCIPFPRPSVEFRGGHLSEGFRNTFRE
jgi:hypothetical protein